MNKFFKAFLLCTLIVVLLTGGAVLLSETIVGESSNECTTIQCDSIPCDSTQCDSINN